MDRIDPTIRKTIAIATNLFKACPSSGYVYLVIGEDSGWSCVRMLFYQDHDDEVPLNELYAFDSVSILKVIKHIEDPWCKSHDHKDTSNP